MAVCGSSILNITARMSKVVYICKTANRTKKGAKYSEGIVIKPCV